MPESLPLPQFPAVPAQSDPARASPGGLDASNGISEGHNNAQTPRSSARIMVQRVSTGLARSLYIHVPFCFHKCHYCDFYSIVDTRDRQEAFTQRICQELAALAPWAGPLSTIFVGGGTPSLLRADLWQRLLDTLHRHYDLPRPAQAPGRDFEWTVECNPETVTPDLLKTLQAGGVTRVSIGAQSFHPAHLKTLERWHDPANVAKAVAIARDAGIMRQSLDLIYAVPGQTLEQWDADLSTALALGTEHLSCYALTYEPNTAMTARLKRGQFAKADEDLEADMFEHTLTRLRSAGLDRYEVSNFARPLGECRHNLAYWRQHDWLAAGPSASAHLAGYRWKNTPRLDDYLSQSDEGFSPVLDCETPDLRRNLGELLWTALRTREGVDATHIRTQAQSLAAVVGAQVDRVAQKQRSLGNLIDEGGRWSLTDQGMLIADSIAVEFLVALDGPPPS